MTEWIEVNVPIRGRLLVEFDGLPGQSVVAEFTQTVPVRIDAPEGSNPPTVRLLAPFNK